MTARQKKKKDVLFDDINIKLQKTQLISSDSRSMVSCGGGGRRNRRAGFHGGRKNLLGMMDVLIILITVMVS